MTPNPGLKISIKGYTIEELEALPPPTWLIDGVLPRGGFAQLGGPAGGNKTFMALHWCCQLAADGHRVVVVVMEGQSGIAARIRAWEKYYGRSVGRNLIVVRDPVYVMHPAPLRAMAQYLYSLAPVSLVLIDTWARAMAGFDENKTADVNSAVENVNRYLINPSGGAAVMVVTHFGWTELRQRGSSALFAACDSVIYMLPARAKGAAAVEDNDDDEDLVVEGNKPPTPISNVWIEKQKDAEDHLSWGTMERIEVPGTPSCVLVPYQKKPRPPSKSKSNGHAKVTPSNVTAFRKMR